MKLNYQQLLHDIEAATDVLEVQLEYAQQAAAVAKAKRNAYFAASREAHEARKDIRATQRDVNRLHRAIAIEDAKAQARDLVRKAKRVRVRSPFTVA